MDVNKSGMFNRTANLKGIFCLVCFLISFGFSITRAQSEILNTRISGEYTNMALSQILHDIENKANTRFSYSPGKIPADTKLTISFHDLPLSEVLMKLFRDLPVRYELTDNYIILKKGELEESGSLEIQDKQRDESPTYTIHGYIRDNKTGELLIGAAIYIQELQLGAISNTYGYYSLTLHPGNIRW
jgi:hypothetical protein